MGQSESQLRQKRLAHHDSIAKMLAVEPLAFQMWHMFDSSRRVKSFSDCDQRRGMTLLTRASWTFGAREWRRMCRQAYNQVDAVTRLYRLGDSSGSNLVKLRFLGWMLFRATTQWCPSLETTPGRPGTPEEVAAWQLVNSLVSPTARQAWRALHPELGPVCPSRMFQALNQSVLVAVVLACRAVRPKLPAQAPLDRLNFLEDGADDMARLVG